MRCEPLTSLILITAQSLINPSQLHFVNPLRDLVLHPFEQLVRPLRIVEDDATVIPDLAVNLVAALRVDGGEFGACQLDSFNPLIALSGREDSRQFEDERFLEI